MRNISAMDRKEVDAIVHNVLDLLDKVQKEHEGQTCPFTDQLFFAVYDLQTLEPKSAYKAALDNAVAMMKEAGVPISDGLF